MSERDLEAGAATALQHIARNEEIKTYVMRNAPLREALLRAALRFLCGETLYECLKAAKVLNGGGHATTIDYMGESTRDEQMAERATSEFLSVVRTISQESLDSSISLDLSHVGLALDADLAFRNASRIARAARDAGIEMMISMEGSERTGSILELHRRLSEAFDNVGITLQAYLYQTDDHLESVLQRPGRIRLVKGAYEEPDRIARPRKSPVVDDAYRRLMEMLLESGHSCSIATHDPDLLDHAHEFIQAHDLSPVAFEFEMLYGITPERLQKMHELGYRTRTYLVYGEEWYLYLCHRLAEHPPNIYQAVIDMVGEDSIWR